MKRTLFLNILAIFAVVLLMVSSLGFIQPTYAKPVSVIHVYPGESIQSAINSANPGTTIIVHSGVYTENLVINKTLRLVGVGWPVVDGGNLSTTVMITWDGVILKGFKIVNGNPYGINVNSDTELSEGVKILNNIIKLTEKDADGSVPVPGTGIFVSGKAYAGWKTTILICNNYVVNNEGWGLYIVGAEGKQPPTIKIMYNKFSSNSFDGIGLETVSYAKIEKNIISNNGPGYVGISIFDYCHDITVKRNIIRNNDWGGIWIDHRNNYNITIKYNLILNHRGEPGVGIEIEQPDTIDVLETTIVEGNLIIRNNYGIVLWGGPEENPYPKNIFARNEVNYATSY